MLAFGADWDEPYSCEEWASEFGLTYPIVDFETGADSWMLEAIPELFWMTNYFGLWIPSYFIIDQNIEIIGGGSGSLTNEEFFLELTSILFCNEIYGTSLQRVSKSFIKFLS